VRLEDEIVNTFIKRITALKEDEREQLVATLNSDNNPILIQSAFALSKDQQAPIKKAILHLIGNERPFQFNATSELIGGIELSTNGYKLSWSISEYLKSLEKNITKVPENNPENSLKNK
jgi:F-type H+-transporting ATPase subunit b